MLAAGFPHVYLFRPAYIYPVEPRNEPNFSYWLLRTVYPVFRVLFPNQVIRADDLARAMVDLVLRQTWIRIEKTPSPQSIDASLTLNRVTRSP